MKKNISVLTASLLMAACATAFSSCKDDDLSKIYQGSMENGSTDSSIDWIDAADKSTDTFIRYFFKANPDDNSDKPLFVGNVRWILPDVIESGNPPTATGYSGGGWSQGHGLDVVTDSYIRSTDPEYRKKIREEVYAPFLVAYPYWNGRNFAGNNYDGKGWWNNFYDDMEWACLATLRVYEEIKDEDPDLAQRYWDATMIQWKFIQTADNGRAGGGLAWKWDTPNSRMSCSSGPGCLLAMKLYKVYKEEGKEADAEFCLDFAKRTYNWMTAWLCDTSTGQVYDNLGLKENGVDEEGNTVYVCGDPDKVALSYNQGTFMGSALALYNATGEEEYLRNAISFAAYQVNHKMDSDYPVFSGEGSNGDNQLFRGIFVRYFLDMLKQPTNDVYKESRKKKFAAALEGCADVLWTMGKAQNQYVFENNWKVAPTLGNRGDENECKVEGNSEIPAATVIEIRARYENWKNGVETEKPNWVNPDLNK